MRPSDVHSFSTKRAIRGICRGVQPDPARPSLRQSVILGSEVARRLDLAWRIRMSGVKVEGAEHGTGGDQVPVRRVPLGFASPVAGDGGRRVEERFSGQRLLGLNRGLFSSRVLIVQ